MYVCCVCGCECVCVCESLGETEFKRGDVDGKSRNREVQLPWEFLLLKALR